MTSMYHVFCRFKNSQFSHFSKYFAIASPAMQPTPNLTFDSNEVMYCSKIPNRLQHDLNVQPDYNKHYFSDILSNGQTAQMSIVLLQKESIRKKYWPELLFSKKLHKVIHPAYKEPYLGVSHRFGWNLAHVNYDQK